MDAHLAMPSQLPAHPIEKSGVNESGNTLHDFLNYFSARQNFTYGQHAGSDLFTGKPITTWQTVDLAPWDLVIVVEN